MTSPLSPDGSNPIHPNEQPGHVSSFEALDAKTGDQKTGFAAMFPAATPEQLKQIVGNFLNSLMQQMKQENQRTLEALKKMNPDNEDDN